MDINITAKSIEQFKQIESDLQKLPSVITDQISTAEISLTGIKCTFKGNLNKIILPNNIKRMNKYDDQIDVICDYFYFIIIDVYPKSFEFIECPNIIIKGD